MPENDASTSSELDVQFHSAAWQPESKPVAPKTLTLYSLGDRVGLTRHSRIPFAVGDPYEYKHEKYGCRHHRANPARGRHDGGATHIMVLQTRPAGATVKASVLDPLIGATCNQISPALEDL